MAKLKPEQVEAFYAALAKANPNPRGELDYINPYTLLVAVVLSAQATDVSVNKATEPLFKVADTPEKMLKLGEARLKGSIKTIGLYNTKAKNVMALSRILVEQFKGEIPRDREHVLAGREAGAVADAEDVRVDRDGRLAEGDVEHDIRGLPADARQRRARLL